MKNLQRRTRRTNEKRIVKSFGNHLKFVAKKYREIRAKKAELEMKAAKYEVIRLARLEVEEMRNKTFKTGKITPVLQSLQAA